MWSARAGTSAIDRLFALHLALAALEGARLVTADQHLYTAALTLGVDALLFTAGQGET